jgi:hypothetical protein
MKWLYILSLGAAIAHGAQHNMVRHEADPADCESTTVLPTLTIVEDHPGMYTQCYTVTYDEWCYDGLRPHAYTITETCSKLPCRGPADTGMAPGFTHAAVACSSCGSVGADVTEVLTFPIESIASMTSAGYQLSRIPLPTETPLSLEPLPTGGSLHTPVSPTHHPIQAGGTHIWANRVEIKEIILGTLGLFVAAVL